MSAAGSARSKQDTGCWYDRIAAGLAASVEGESLEPRVRASRKAFDFTEQLGAAGWSGEGYELVNDGRIVVPEQQELALEPTARLEAWAREPAPDEPNPPTPLAPSQPLPDEARNEPRAFSPLASDDRKRWQRGRLMHELLRHLPALPAADRAAAARRFLAQAAHGLDEEEIASWAAEALAVTEAPGHQALFAEGSRAEVPLIGSVQTSRGIFTVSGQVDRLAVTAREVLIVDYKTNRPPPAEAGGVALAYRRQLALYRALLARNLSITRCAGFSAVDGNAPIDGDRCRNARRFNALLRATLTCPDSLPSFCHKGGAGPLTGSIVFGRPTMTVKATDASFEQEVLKSDTPVLVDFWAEWCGPCRMIGPSLEDIAKDMDGKLKVVKVNIDENPMVPTRYGVRSIPTLLLFKNGQVAATKIGAEPKQKLVSWINSNVA